VHGSGTRGNTTATRRIVGASMRNSSSRQALTCSPNHGLPLAFRADCGASRELIMHRGRGGPTRHYLIVLVCVPAPTSGGAGLCLGRYLGNTNARSGAEENTT
jgi:hypothetical protein